MSFDQAGQFISSFRTSAFRRHKSIGVHQLALSNHSPIQPLCDSTLSRVTDSFAQLYNHASAFSRLGLMTETSMEERPSKSAKLLPESLFSQPLCGLLRKRNQDRKRFGRAGRHIHHHNTENQPQSLHVCLLYCQMVNLICCSIFSHPAHDLVKSKLRGPLNTITVAPDKHQPRILRVKPHCCPLDSRKVECTDRATRGCRRLLAEHDPNQNAKNNKPIASNFSSCFGAWSICPAGLSPRSPIRKAASTALAMKHGSRYDTMSG